MSDDREVLLKIATPLTHTVREFVSHLGSPAVAQVPGIAEAAGVLESHCVADTLFNAEQRFPIPLQAVEAIIKSCKVLSERALLPRDFQIVPFLVSLTLSPAIWAEAERLAAEGDEQAAWQVVRRKGARVIASLDSQSARNTGLDMGLTLLEDIAAWAKDKQDAEIARAGSLLQTALLAANEH